MSVAETLLRLLASDIDRLGVNLQRSMRSQSSFAHAVFASPSLHPEGRNFPFSACSECITTRPSERENTRGWLALDTDQVRHGNA